eukprot:XP_011611220.1 PREDICTED: hemogen isoform X1 [Takifugu rubripes]
MEDPFQQKRKESPYKDQNEEQGGIRRRLRDRDLLRKRKAEAEEKETNQWVYGEESPTKRRTRNNGGAKKRGRPRKAEPEQEISAAQEEAAVAAGPAVVASEPVQIDPDQTFFTLTAVESQAASVTAAPLPVFGSVQSFTPSTNLTQAPSVLAAAPTKVPGEGQFPVQEETPASAPDAPVLIQAPAPAAPPAADVGPPAAPNQMQEQDKEGQVTIEDVGPDEEQDLSVSQTKRAEEDVKETASADMNEQSKMPSAPSFSSPPPPQEYVSENLL